MARLVDACVDSGLSLMSLPADPDAAFRKFIPAFGAAGNRVDVTRGEAPFTYKSTLRLGMQGPAHTRDHSGPVHATVTPQVAFAKLVVEVKEKMQANGIEKPIVASLAADVEVDTAFEYLQEPGIAVYHPCSS